VLITAYDILFFWVARMMMFGLYAMRGKYPTEAVPVQTIVLHGLVRDQFGKKMSKSKGNVVTPMHLLQEHGADAVRYWAANGRPGTDTAFDAQQMKVGRRLAVKLLNASKFALADLPAAGERLTNPLDRAMSARLATVVDDATASFEDYDYARALQHTEELFWWFCDFYLELVKGRRYDSAGDPDGAASVSRALRLSVSTFQRLFAPFLPFVCEEVWSWWQTGSIHLAPWPEADELLAELARGGDGREDGHGEDGHEEDEALTVAADVLREVRKAKSQARQPMRAPVRLVRVHDTPARLRALELGLGDLRQAGAIEHVEPVESDELAVEVELA
jgi:valyl-tRNA synthetase